MKESQPAEIPIQEMMKVATENGQANVVEYCLQQGAQIDSDVSRAALNGATPELWRLLFSANWNNVQNDSSLLDSLLVLSTRRGKPMVNFLLDQGARCKPAAVSMVARSNKADNVDIMSLLLARGGALHDSGALQMAAYDGTPDMVRFLLDQGADVNEIPKNDPGDPRECRNGTALHQAVGAGRLSIIELLLDRGADASLLDQGGLDAMGIAKERNIPDQQAVLALLEKRLRPDDGNI